MVDSPLDVLFGAVVGAVVPPTLRFFWVRLTRLFSSIRNQVMGRPRQDVETYGRWTQGVDEFRRNRNLYSESDALTEIEMNQNVFNWYAAGWRDVLSNPRFVVFASLWLIALAGILIGSYYLTDILFAVGIGVGYFVYVILIIVTDH